jgi:hypothetical protein
MRDAAASGDSRDCLEIEDFGEVVEGFRGSRFDTWEGKSFENWVRRIWSMSARSKFGGLEGLSLGTMMDDGGGSQPA